MTPTELDQISYRFFKLFAQYEYALKAMGYGRAGRLKAAEVDWDRFANEIGIALIRSQDHAVVEARTYLLDHPPKRQVWINNSVDWAVVPSVDRSAQSLFGHLRRVRNNLYHGGKFNGRWIDPDRSEELITRSLALLQHLVRDNQDLREAIHGNAG
ncbi:MAG: hypothetical protein RLO04_05110 [Limnobacter sp.]|uniref:hypothetical protein n=1 Tax=Limnobacter sp. TaxID=2003368 RepID=UPI0032EB798F